MHKTQNDHHHLDWQDFLLRHDKPPTLYSVNSYKNQWGGWGMVSDSQSSDTLLTRVECECETVR